MTENTSVTPPTPSSAYKLVEVGENGELKLLKENLDRFLSHLQNAEGNSDIPIAVVSLLGPPMSGKSFFANLLMEYLRHDGEGWTKTMKQSGLRGFPYGADNNRVFHEEDESSNGVYFWPQLFRHCAGKEILLLVMDVHRESDGEEQVQSGKNPLDLFAAVSSSRIADIVWKEKMSVTELLQNDDTVEVKALVPHMCQSIVYLERGTKHGKEKKISAKKEGSVKMQEYSHPLHDKSGGIQFSLQAIVIRKFMRAILEESELHPKTFGIEKSVLKIESIGNFLDHCVQLINSRGTCSIPASNERDENIEPPAKENGHSGILENHEQDTPEHNKEESELEIKAVNKITSTPTTEQKDLIQFSDVETEKEKNTELETYKQKLASQSIWPELHGSLTNWISRELTRENIGDIKQLFAESLPHIYNQKLVKLKDMGMPEADSIEFIEYIQLKDRQEEKFLKCFLAVENGFRLFCSKIDANFIKTAFLSPEDLKLICKGIVENICTIIGSNAIKDLFEIGVTMRLAPFYESYNYKIRNLSMECTHQIRNFYKIEMAKIVRRGQFQSPKKLAEIHKRLVLELQDVYNMTMAMGSSTPAADLSHPLKDLEQQLNHDFIEHERKNVILIEVAMKNIKKLILKWNGEYQVRLGQLLDDSPDGIQPEVFSDRSHEIENEIIEQFKEETLPKLYNTASIDKYLQTLNKYIEDSREDLMEENEDKWKRNTEKLQQCQPGPSQRVNGQVETAHQSERTGKTLLLVQLGLEKIGVGIMKNSSIETLKYHLPEIGLTWSNEWVCGNELLLESNNQQLLRRHWYIGSFILRTNHPEGTEIMDIGDVNLEIRIEFLLAVFFRGIKQEADAIMITVPFWCTSVQRQMILDAAQIAGFTISNVELFSENSAAAYHMYESGQHEQKYDTIVFSENSEMLDISLYSYDFDKSKLLMLSHCGECETSSNFGEENNHGWFMGKVYSIFTYLTSGRQSSDKDEKLMMTKIEKMCENTIYKAGRQDFKQTPPLRFLICCQSEKSETYNSMLVNVAKKISLSKEYITVENRAPIFGLASIHKVHCNNISMSPETIIKEGMAFDVNIKWTDYWGHVKKLEVFNKANTFTLNAKSVQRKLFDRKSICITQDNHRTNSEIAQLHVGNSDHSNSKYAVILQRSHQGIIKLRNPECIKYTKMTNWPTTRQMKPDEYKWNTVNLSDEDELKGIYLSIMDQIRFYSNLAIRLAEGKQQILDKLKQILNAINEGNGTFKSLALKALVKNQLEETLEQLKNSKTITENELKQKGDFLKSIVEKYKFENC